MPEGLDWEQWCNQTELRPYHQKLHRNWALWTDYDGGGQSWGVTGWGAHSLDQVQAALGASRTGPVEISPDGPGPRAVVTLRYANGAEVVLEQEIIKDHQQLGAIFLGSKSKLQIVRGDFIPEDTDLKKAAPDVDQRGPGRGCFSFE